MCAASVAISSLLQSLYTYPPFYIHSSSVEQDYSRYESRHSLTFVNNPKYINLYRGPKFVYADIIFLKLLLLNYFRIPSVR